MVVQINEAASSQNILIYNGTAPELTRITACFFRWVLGIGHPLRGKRPALAWIQKIRSRNVFMTAVAAPIFTGVPNM